MISLHVSTLSFVAAVAGLACDTCRGWSNSLPLPARSRSSLTCHSCPVSPSLLQRSRNRAVSPAAGWKKPPQKRSPEAANGAQPAHLRFFSATIWLLRGRREPGPRRRGVTGRRRCTDRGRRWRGTCSGSARRCGGWAPS
jgi:hypothetical protein